MYFYKALPTEIFSHSPCIAGSVVVLLHHDIPLVLGVSKQTQTLRKLEICLVPFRKQEYSTCGMCFICSTRHLLMSFLHSFGTPDVFGGWNQGRCYTCLFIGAIVVIGQKDPPSSPLPSPPLPQEPP